MMAWETEDHAIVPAAVTGGAFAPAPKQPQPGLPCEASDTTPARASDEAPAGVADEAPEGAWRHTAESLKALVTEASVALPAAVTGGEPFLGRWRQLPAATGRKVPVVVFLHGSSGLAPKAIGEWQAWLAGLGIASVAPDSFALPGRLTYMSPAAKLVYERIHALRAAEIAPALAALKRTSWSDGDALILAGSSEGAVTVARYGGTEFAARLIFSWSCEDNYFVTGHRTHVRVGQPVLNVMSATDPYFAPGPPWLGNPAALGHGATTFRGDPAAMIVLVPGAPHTLFNLPQVRAVTRAFIEQSLGR
jgi:dienelactone hydrolase